MEKTKCEIMTVKEAADYLRVKENTVRIWIRLGKLPVLRSDKSDMVRLRRSDVEGFLSGEDK